MWCDDGGDCVRERLEGGCSMLKWELRARGIQESNLLNSTAGCSMYCYFGRLSLSNPDYSYSTSISQILSPVSNIRMKEGDMVL